MQLPRATFVPEPGRLVKTLLLIFDELRYEALTRALSTLALRCEAVTRDDAVPGLEAYARALRRSSVAQDLARPSAGP